MTGSLENPCSRTSAIASPTDDCAETPTMSVRGTMTSPTVVTANSKMPEMRSVPSLSTAPARSPSFARRDRSWSFVSRLLHCLASTPSTLFSPRAMADTTTMTGENAQ